MKVFRRPKDAIAAPLEQAVESVTERRVADTDFAVAPYNPEEGERGGYSNYSY